MWEGYKTCEKGTKHVEGVGDMWKGYETCGKGTKHVEGYKTC